MIPASVKDTNVPTKPGTEFFNTLQSLTTEDSNTSNTLEALNALEEDYLYEQQSAYRDYCERWEPTYNPEDGSM